MGPYEAYLFLFSSGLTDSTETELWFFHSTADWYTANSSCSAKNLRLLSISTSLKDFAVQDKIRSV